MPMEYKPRKKKQLKPKLGRKRGRPRKDEYIEIEVSPGEQVIQSTDELEAIKRNIDMLQKQLANLTGVEAAKVETIQDLDDTKVKRGNILSIDKRNNLEHDIKKYESMLRDKETSLGRAAGSGGGLAECFTNNRRIDKGLVYNKLARAKKALSDGTVGRISASDQQKLGRRKNEIERILKDTLPSLSDCNSSDNSKTDELAHYLIAHGKKYGRMEVELKNINKILEPENPMAGDLRYLWRK